MGSLFENKEVDKFWISYLAAHTDPGNRMCHYLGTIFGILSGLLVGIFVNPLVGLAMLTTGVILALVGHFVFQKNSPRGGKPLLGIICDLVMLYLYIFNRTKLNEQLSRVVIEQAMQLHSDPAAIRKKSRHTGSSIRPKAK